MMRKELCHGNNLDFLRSLPDESVDLIATDPPFNTGREFSSGSGHFTDRWAWDWKSDNLLSEIGSQNLNARQVVTTAKVVGGEDTGAFLCWLGLRLLEMRRVLTDNGSLYLHVDSTAQAWMKCLLDAIFANQNFRSEITWKRTSAHNDGGQGRKQHGRIHDVILFYTKSDDWTWNPVYTEYDPRYVADFYKYVDDTGRKYRLGDITGRGGAARGNPEYEVMGVTRHWCYSEKRMRELIDEGRIVQTAPGKVPHYKRYLDEMPGVSLQDLWTDIGPLASQAKERTGYPTQKPLALYDRIIRGVLKPRRRRPRPLRRLRDDLDRGGEIWAGSGWEWTYGPTTPSALS